MSRKWSPIKGKAKVLVLASGGGTTFEALVKEAQANNYSYEVVGLVTNSKKSGCQERAERLDVPAFFVQYSPKYPEEFFEDVTELCEELEVEVIALAGFLLLLREPLLTKYSGKILNTHPSLLPKFGGKGLYGDRVHQAVLDAGESESGVTIHEVNERYDEGQILGVKKVKVLKGDSVETLSERVRSEERSFYPLVLNQFVTSLGFG
ncbi:phosphoribosylglycinamide formyltransferase [bacterium]|nr:phosphoribosylglycinamide formyltransferase [bacterium]